MNITKFFDSDYINYSAYDNYRSIASYIDGLKPTARKVIYTCNKLNINSPLKVENLQAKVSDTTEYLHGAGSIGGVIVNMVQNYVGANNLPLLKGEGTFGTRLIPVAAATRYIAAYKDKITDSIFKKEDEAILISQVFEGTTIEPQYYVPIVPLILVNGCMNALSVAFASHILPRKLEEIIEAIKDILEGKEPKELNPYFKDFNGIVLKNEEGSIETRGLWSRKSSNPKEIIITELPIGVTLDKYKDILNTLQDKKVITSYKDLSDTKKDKFHFIVRTSKVIHDDKVVETLKLVKKDSENLTCIDENNKIRVFESIYEILRAYVEIRLVYYAKRKAYIIHELEQELKVLNNKFKFLKHVISGELVVFKRKRKDIEEDLKKFDIEQLEDSYDYILKIPVDWFTEERLLVLIKKIKDSKASLKTIQEKEPKDFWLEDLKQLEGVI